MQSVEKTKSGSIVWFSDTRQEDIASVGGKASNLGELIHAGLPVPPGFTVATTVFRRFIEATDLKSIITEQLHLLDVNNSTDLDTRAAVIQKAITDQLMPLAVAADITDAYRELSGGEDKMVAIRSSATAEDLADASFAGQQATYLNVVGSDEVARAVQACWASLYESRAIFYRATQGFDHTAVDLAVVVQLMVQAEKAGVMFTNNSMSGDPDQIEISAVYGLGEALVSGEVTSDTYIYAKSTGQVIERNVIPQTTMLTKEQGSSGGLAHTNSWYPVPLEQVDTPKLSDVQVQDLATIGQKIETHYGAAQDIEWAFADGQFYLLQARPITVQSHDYTLDDTPLPDEPAKILLTGQPASLGVGTGKVRILKGPEECNLIEPGDILVAAMTTPDYVPAMQRAAGIITERGSRTCHAAIVSRELGVPCVVGALHATTTLTTGQTVTVDGSHGAIFDGRAETRLAWDRIRRASLAADQQSEATPTRTKVMVIMADPERAASVAARQVDGVGLLRAEFILARIGKHPRAFLKEGHGEQYTEQLAAGITAFCEAFGSRPVVYRLLDFKTNELANLTGGAEFESAEENPMLGFRGAARYAKDPEVFALELDAIKRVRAKFKNLYVMIPFVRTPAELHQVIDLMARHGLKRSDDFKLWIMAELPSNVLILDKFIDEGIDGVSIGSNDLTQLILGMDRDNECLAGIGDERNEAVMTAIHTIITTALARGITVSICGQAPSDFPEVTQKLVGWGITSISVNSDMLERTRQIVKACEDEG